jgi:hypothetical protein
MWREAMSESNGVSLDSILSQMETVRRDRDRIVQEIYDADGELVKLNALFSGGAHVPNYGAVCREQDKLKQRLSVLRKRAAKMKTEIRELEAERKRLVPYEPDPPQPSNLRIERDDIVEMRDYYLDFAKDQTRVASMRAMAAEFAKKLNDLLAKGYAKRGPR